MALSCKRRMQASMAWLFDTAEKAYFHGIDIFGTGRCCTEDAIDLAQGQVLSPMCGGLPWCCGQPARLHRSIKQHVEPAGKARHTAFAHCKPAHQNSACQSSDGMQLASHAPPNICQAYLPGISWSGRSRHRSFYCAGHASGQIHFPSASCNRTSVSAMQQFRLAASGPDERHLRSASPC